VANALDFTAESARSGQSLEQPAPCTLAELQARLASLQVDHLEVTEQIQSFRRRLRDGQLRAYDTHFRSGSRRDLTGIGSALFSHLTNATSSADQT
jgi:hypothetical protein